MPPKSKSRRKPFPFFSLPSELRIRIYELALVVPSPIDLTPTNHYALAPLLQVFFVCRRMHDEAYHVFYGCNTFRLFPVHGRFINKNKPLTVRLAPKYRAALTMLDLRLGPGWNKPPPGWIVTPKLGLDDMVNVRLLRIFIELDPANSDIYEGFRVSKEFYTVFSKELVRSLFEHIASLKDVEFDAYKSVMPDGPLMEALLAECRESGKRVLWGPEREWFKKPSDQVMAELDQRMSLINIGGEVLESVAVH